MVSVPFPEKLKKVRPRAYVISLGVNASQTRPLDLLFAASDAQAMKNGLFSSRFIEFPRSDVPCLSKHEVLSPSSSRPAKGIWSLNASRRSTSTATRGRSKRTVKCMLT